MKSGPGINVVAVVVVVVVVIRERESGWWGHRWLLVQYMLMGVEGREELVKNIIYLCIYALDFIMLLGSILYDYTGCSLG